MRYRVLGDTMPAVEVVFDAPGETMYTQSGGMAWMSEGISMNSNMKGGLGNRQDVFRGIPVYGNLQGGAPWGNDCICLHRCRRGSSRQYRRY